MTESQAEKLATADDLRSEVDLLTARIDDLTRFLVEATTKRDELAAENVELKAGLFRWETRCSKETDEMIAREAKLQAEVDRLAAENAELKLWLKLSRNGERDATATADERAQAIFDIRQERDQLRSENKELRARVGKLEQLDAMHGAPRIATLEAENDKLKTLHAERFNALLLTYETCAGLQERTARERDALRDQVDSCHAYDISKERDQLRELAGELLNAWIGIPALPPSAAPFHKARRIAKEKRSADQSALLARARALGVEVGR